MKTQNSSTTTPDREIIIGNWVVTLDHHKFSICGNSKSILGIHRHLNPPLKDLLRLLEIGQRWKFIKDFTNAVNLRSDFETRVKIVTPSGSVKWISVTGVLNYKRWGQPVKMVGVIKDVTQKVTEESINLSIVNHELRTPLTIIKLNVQLSIKLLKMSSHADAVKMLYKSEFYVDMMTKILDEYGTNSNLEGQLFKAHFTMFNIGQLIESVVTEMQVIYPEHRFRLKVPENAHVFADKFKIIQVLVNYLTNAVNYSAINGPIQVTAECQENHISVSVKDSGIGLPVGSEIRIFEKFYRGKDNKTSRGHKGLGLYLVKDIIEQHGGTVKAKKEIEKGSSFYFTLPLA
jgi:two-component system CheB/CheR fusion protein